MIPIDDTLRFNDCNETPSLPGKKISRDFELMLMVIIDKTCKCAAIR